MFGPLLGKALDKIVHHVVERLRVIHEQCVTVAVEELEAEFIAEL
jgi:hypothetical protein